MLISFWLPVRRSPTGGVLSTVALAGAMADHGHDVHLWLSRFSPQDPPVQSLDDVAWLSVSDGVRVLFDHDRESTRPDRLRVDICVGMPVPGALPVLFMRGEPTEAQRPHVYSHPWPMAVISTWLAELATEQGFATERLVVVPNGLDHAVFRPIRAVDDRDRQVSMLHHLAPSKRAGLGLEVLTAVREQVPGVGVTLFGAAEPRERLPEWVTFRCRPDRRTLAEEVYNAAQVHLCPSVTEGFGNTSLEAMASGCALVTVDNGGSRDFATHDQTATVVPADDADAMVAAIRELLVDANLRHERSRAGIERAAEFTWDRSAAAFERFLDEYLGDPHRFVAADALDSWTRDPMQFLG